MTINFTDGRLQTEVTTFLTKNWLSGFSRISTSTYYSEFLCRLMGQDADMLTIGFILQHIRTKVIFEKENFELDCGIASQLISMYKKSLNVLEILAKRNDDHAALKASEKLREFAERYIKNYSNTLQPPVKYYDPLTDTCKYKLMDDEYSFDMHEQKFLEKLLFGKKNI